MHAHQRAHSISSPITQNFPSSASVPLTRPSHKPRRPSFSNTMESLKSKGLERLERTKGRIHENIAAYSHKRGNSETTSTASATAPAPASSPVARYLPLRKTDTKQHFSSAGRDSEISVPQLNGSSDSLPVKRLGELGKGATVVNTPQEALAIANMRSNRSNPAAASAPMLDRYYTRYTTVEEENSDFDSPPNSAAVPPVPVASSSRANSPALSSHGRNNYNLNDPPPRRSEESSRSAHTQNSSNGHSGQGHGSRGFGPVLPDLRRANGTSSPVPRTQQRRSPLVPQYTPSSKSNSRAPSRNEDHQPRRVQQYREPEPEPEPEESSFSIPDEPEPAPEPEPEEELRLNREVLERPPSNGSATGASMVSQAHSSAFVNAPAIPLAIASVPLQPPFAPVLLSNLPANMHKFERGKVMIILEMGDKTIKSTLETLTKRPSYLAQYLEELVESTVDGGHRRDREGPARPGYGYGYEKDDGRSAYTPSQKSQFEEFSEEETSPGFSSIFQNHIASAGVLKAAKIQRRADRTSMMHVFLDRPSLPYAHIIAYLRAPLEAYPPTGLLPYAARLFPAPAAGNSFATARLESLLDLRDEAAYLGLEDLLSLCDEELAGTVPLALSSPPASELGRSGGDNDAADLHAGLGLRIGGRDAAEREHGSEGGGTAASVRTLYDPHDQHTHTHTTQSPRSQTQREKSRERKEKGVGMAASPANRSVDIPILLPSSPRTRTLSTATDGSAVSEARRERRVGHVGVPPVSSGTIAGTNNNSATTTTDAFANSAQESRFDTGRGRGIEQRPMQTHGLGHGSPPPSAMQSPVAKIANASQLRAASRDREWNRAKPPGNYF